MKSISSSTNPRIKQFAKLAQKSSERKQKGSFVVEGIREIELALEGGYSIETLCVCPEIALESRLQKLYPKVGEVITLSLEAYQKIAQRKTTEGAIAIGKSKQHNIETLNITHQNALVLVVESPEKPGNIGALLRTADAAKLDAVIIANPKTDIYNPNVIRNSVGALFTVPIAEATSTEVLEYLKHYKYNIYAAYLDEKSKDYSTINYSGSTAIVVGTEDKGLQDLWLENSSKNIIIPMRGKIDSVNVSVATAIIVFEALRQRHKRNLN